jgi:hypothetical protein
MPLLSDLSPYHFPLLYAAALYQAPFSQTKLLELMQLNHLIQHGFLFHIFNTKLMGPF